MRFAPGRIVATPGALKAMAAAGLEPAALLDRHLNGDFGDLCPEDRAENEWALKRELRILSSYPLSTGQKIWIITEADRSCTTFLLPSEY